MVWTRDEESALIAAVTQYKKRNWRKIIEDPKFSQVLGRHSTRSLSVKWTHMVTTNKIVDVGPNGEAPAYTVDILTPMNDSGLLKKLWDSRHVEYVAVDLARLAATKHIKPGDFSEVCITLMQLMAHPKSVVVVKAIEAIANLASDLKTHFKFHSLSMVPYLLKNLEMEEPTVTKAVTKTLQIIYEAGSLDLGGYIKHHVKKAMKNKVPRVRSLTLNWVTFCLKMSNKDSILKYYEEYFHLCMERLDDETQEVRVAAFLALTALNVFSLSCVITCLPGSCKFGSRGFRRHRHCVRSRGCCKKSRGLRTFC